MQLTVRNPNSIEALQAAGELEDYVRDADRARRDVGQIGFVHAVRAG